MQKQCLFPRILYNAFVVLLVCSVTIAQSGAQSSGQSAKSGAAASQAPTPSTAPFESQMLAYGALDQVTTAIAKCVCAKTGAKATIIIYDPPSFATIQSYRGFLQGVEILKKAYESLVSDEEHLSKNRKSQVQQKVK